MPTYNYPAYRTNAFTGDPYNRIQEWRDMMYTGERVVGLYEDYIGTIADMVDDGFKVDRPYADDVYLPFDAIKDIHDGEVQLKIPIDEVGAAWGPFNRAHQGEGGPYTGYGPRNYRRSDDRIRDDISDRMWSDGELDAGGITIGVDEGVVTLDGTVDSRWAKRRADDIAWSVPGVIDVVDNLRPLRQAPRQV